MSSLKSLLKSPGKWIIALMVLALGVTGYGIYLALRPAANSQNVVPSPSPAADKSTSGAIAALGRLEPGGEVFCIAPPSGSGFNSVIRKWMVKEGDLVKQNQVMAVMDTYDRLYSTALQAEAQTREAQVKVAQAQIGSKDTDIDAQQSQIDAKQAEVDRRGAELKIAADEYKRYLQLYQDGKEGGGAVSASAVDQRRLVFETAKGSFIQAEKELEQAKKTKRTLAQVRPMDVQQADVALQVAIANLRRAQADLDTALTRSPITGQVLKIMIKEGEQTSSAPGSGGSKDCNGIAEVGRTDQMYAVAEVYETEIVKVRQGQKATITSTAFPEPISGTVERVGLKIGKKDVLSTDPAADIDARVVEVRIRLDNSKPVANLTNLQVNVKIQP